MFPQKETEGDCMAIVDFTVFSGGFVAPIQSEPKRESAPVQEAAPAARSLKGKRFHRIQEVRRQQGVSLRSAARSLGTDIRTVRSQEQANQDLRISELQNWQKALDVPVAELLVESEESLSGPVLERARMIRLMKTAAAIQERAPNDSINRMAQMLIDQLVEIMPELKTVGPWHQVGQRRSGEDFGRVLERRLADDVFSGRHDDE